MTGKTEIIHENSAGWAALVRKHVLTGMVAVGICVASPAAATQTAREFPVLTTTQVADAASGEKFVARQFHLIHQAFGQAMRDKSFASALHISRQMQQVLRDHYGDERDLSTAEFDAVFTITSGTGFRFIQQMHIAINSEVSALLELRDYSTAIRMLEEDMHLDRKLFGQASPYYLAELEEHALIAKAGGDFAMAQRWLAEAVRVTEIMFGRQSRQRADALLALGLLQSDLGRNETAKLHADDAIAMFRELGIASGYEFRLALADSALIYTRSGDFPAAEAAISRVIGLLERANLTDSLEYGGHLGQLANLLARKGDIAKAERLQLAAIENARTATSENSAIYALRVVALADLYRDDRRDHLAAALYERAGPVLQASGQGAFLRPRADPATLAKLGPEMVLPGQIDSSTIVDVIKLAPRSGPPVP